MATRERRSVALVATALSAAAAGCSLGQLSYHEIERDLDAIVQQEGKGLDQQLVYRSDVRQSPWYARLMAPLNALFLSLASDTVAVKLENPSGQVRELLRHLGPKAGNDLMRGAASAQRLVRVAALDPSALNRITALQGLAALAEAHEVDFLADLARGPVRGEPLPEIEQRLADFTALRPAQRQPPDQPLSAEAAARYRSALAALAQKPLPVWTQRLALISDLAQALAFEGDDAVVEATTAALRQALHHAVRWAVADALQGRDPAWVPVRLCALDLLHRHGGPDSVPLLLSLMQTDIRAGTPPFDPDETIQMRLIHLCGQLAGERALRRVPLPGRESWQPVCPAEFLASIVLDRDAAGSPLTLPAREALARCLGRPRIGLGDDAEPDAPDWVATWYDDLLRRRTAQQAQ